MTFLPLILDIVVVLFLLIIVIVGWKKGLLRGLVGLISTIVAFFVAIFFAGTVADFAESTFGVTTSITGWMEGVLNGVDGFNVSMSDEGITTALGNLGLPDFLADMVLGVVEQLNIEGAPTIAQVVAPVLAGFIATAICGIALFIVSAIVLNLLAGFLSKVFDKIPVIGAVNHLLGFVLGAVKGLIFVYIVLAVLSILPFEELQDALAQATVISWLYENNLIMLALEQLSAFTPIVDYVQDFIGGLTGSGEETASVILASMPL